MFYSLREIHQLYQGFADIEMEQQKLGGLFDLNHQYMRWTEDMMDMFHYHSGCWWGKGANEYGKLFMSYFNIFQKTAVEFPISTMEAYQRWYEVHFEKYNEVIQEWQQEHPLVNEKNYPADWDEEKESLLIQSVINGTKEGKTLSSIFESVGEEIGIAPTRCSTYWYTKVDQCHRDQLNQIKQELAKNWTKEEEELLTKIVTEEFPNLSIFQAFPIACKRLKRHNADVRRKWFSLQTTKQIRNWKNELNH